MKKVYYSKQNSKKQTETTYKERNLIDNINNQTSNKGVLQTSYKSENTKRIHNTETDIQFQIFDWFNLQYPNKIYRLHCSFNGVKLNIGIAKKMSSRGMQKGEPDLHLYNKNEKFTSLYIELKVESPYKIDGSLKSQKKTDKKTGIIYNHLAKQSEFLMFLQKQGAAATFAVGFDGAKKAITDYIENRFVNKNQTFNNSNPYV